MNSNVDDCTCTSLAAVRSALSDGHRSPKRWAGGDVRALFLCYVLLTTVGADILRSCVEYIPAVNRFSALHCDTVLENLYATSSSSLVGFCVPLAHSGKEVGSAHPDWF